MSQEVLGFVCDFLERDDDVVIPVRRLWNGWRVQHPETPYDEFEAAVLADPRVEVMRGVDETKDMEFENDAEREAYIVEMEEMGFDHGPRVKLAARELTAGHIAAQLKKHTDNMLKNLWAAYDIRPEDLSPEQEQQLLDLLPSRALCK
jgi:hypothetical protein